ncbi:MAG TPA: hypothetical protein PLY93_12620, partial [Turneriella sp.]|nr:hypothetical protein [Turneriella sp.]
MSLVSTFLESQSDVGSACAGEITQTQQVSTIKESTLRALFLLFGIAFGYILIRAGVSSYDVIRDMFLFKSWHMYGVLGVAVPVSFIGLQLFRRTRRKSL